MRVTVLSVAMLVICAGQVVAQDAPSAHERAAAELVDVLQLEKVTLSSIDVMTKAMVDQNPMFAPHKDVFDQFFKEFMRWEDLRPEYIRIYRDAYTEAELNELIAFYRTPIGRKTVEVMPKLMQQGAEIGQKQIQPHLPELQRRVLARMGGGSD